MRTDDPRLDESRKRIAERNEQMGALTLAILRSHLLAEQCMNDMILASNVKRRWLKDATFAEKMTKCRLIAKDDRDDPLWEVLKKANILRNTVAHTLDADMIDVRMKELKETYLSSLTPEQAEGLTGEADDYVAQSACVLCAGFIATIAERQP